MFIELVDSLRCLEPHEETWLVAAVTRMDGRHIVDGTLGCPICRRQYPILRGSGWFTASAPVGGDRRLTNRAPVVEETMSVRAAALLGLTEPGGIVVLGDGWAAYADAIAEMGPAHIVVLNVESRDGSPQTVSSIIVDDRLPFGSGALRGVAVGRELATPMLLASAAGTLRGRGRLVAPAGVSVPDGVEELVRDETDWVAERTAVASAPIALRSTRR